MTDLTGQVALVTGGGSGIGEGIARTLSGAGVRVVICGRRPEPLAKVAAGLQAEGGQTLAVTADVSREDDVERLAQTATEHFGLIDILVNNAGVGDGGYIHNMSVQAWDRVMAINLRGPFLMMRAVIPGMRQQRRGHIINISSEGGLEYYPRGGAYGVTKHALNALGEFVQRENQDAGIRVDTICPGMVITEMTGNLPGLDNDKCLYPADIADLTLWLLTRRANVKIGRPLLIQTMENPWL